MSLFLKSEKARQAALKSNNALFSREAQPDGLLSTRRGKLLYAHGLPQGCEHENLGPSVRRDSIDTFRELGIGWHQGSGDQPSPNLCSSQVCAMNFLMPFARSAALTAALLRPLYPDLSEVLPFEDANGPLYVTFEWIGDANYLRERVSKKGTRSRGRLFTSTDAAIRFRTTGGQLRTILLEWKYTESYPTTSCAIAPKSGTDRRDIYRHLLASGLSPVASENFDDIFYEPFYQLYRQQALAAAMERANEDGSTTVSVLHVSPSVNHRLHKVTSPPLLAFGNDLFQVWDDLLVHSDRFKSVTTDMLFGAMVRDPSSDIREWAEYIQTRYAPLLGAQL